MRDILHPRAVAVFGASESRDKFGGRILYFLLRHGFQGTIVPINPVRREIRGLPAYACLADAPVAVDVAILAVPGDRLETAIAECAAAGVGCCVIITTGFAEADAAGAARQDRLVGIARSAGMRIIGPNCMGLLNPAWHLALCSSVVLDVERMLVGRIGLISQSGALMVSLFDRAFRDGIGFSSCVSLGNQSDVEICDVLDYMIDDPATAAICLYVEGFQDPARFVRAAASCRAGGKPLIVLKTGQTPAGVVAAQSHTASLAGSYESFVAICRAHGVVLVEDPVVMVRVADMLARTRLRGDGIGVFSGSGGGAGIMVDRLSASGFRLARLSNDTRASLREILLPPQADNPIDLGGRLPGAEDITEAAFRAMAADANVGLIVLYLSSMPFFAARAQTMADVARATETPTLALLLPGPAADEPRRILRDAGIPCFDSSEDLLATLRGVVVFHATQPVVPSAERPVGLPRLLPIGDIHALVGSYGIPFAVEAVCPTIDDAVAAVERIGFPIVLKGHFSAIVHKSELGLVRQNIGGLASLRMAWEGIANAVAMAGLADVFLGCLMQEQVVAGLELVLSIRRDPQFGPFVLVGAGGILVELFSDIAMEPAPVTDATALAMLARLRIAALFDGYRGGPTYDIAAAADAIVRLSWLAADLGASLGDLECNPLIVTATGVRAVDLRGTLEVASVIEDQAR